VSGRDRRPQHSHDLLGQITLSVFPTKEGRVVGALAQAGDRVSIHIPAHVPAVLEPGEDLLDEPDPGLHGALLEVVEQLGLRRVSPMKLPMRTIASGLK
jgi:hypothetical protein